MQEQVDYNRQHGRNPNTWTQLTLDASPIDYSQIQLGAQIQQQLANPTQQPANPFADVPVPSQVFSIAPGINFQQQQFAQLQPLPKQGNNSSWPSRPKHHALPQSFLDEAKFLPMSNPAVSLENLSLPLPAMVDALPFPMLACVNSLPQPIMSMELHAPMPGAMVSAPKATGLFFRGVPHPLPGVPTPLTGAPFPSNPEARVAFVNAIKSGLQAGQTQIRQAMANGATPKAAHTVFCAGVEVQTKAVPRKAPPWRSVSNGAANGAANGQPVIAVPSASGTSQPSHRKPQRPRPCTKVGRKSSKRVRWQLDAENEPRLAEVLINSFRGEGEILWYMNPGSVVLCDGCDIEVPQQAGMLCGAPGNSALAQGSFMCLPCIERVPSFDQDRS